MSPKKPVEKLRVLCSKVVIALTLDVIKGSGDKCIEGLKVHYDRLPRVLREELISDILDSTPLHSSSKWVSFCAFQCSGPKFDFRNLSSKFHEKFAQKLENVLYLNLSEAQISDQTLSSLIQRCPHLRALIVPGLATDQLFQHIKHLKNLELLDISGSVRVSPEGWKCLASNSLQVLVLNSVVDPSVIAGVFPQLPNLKEVKFYQHTGQAFLHLTSPLISKLLRLNDSNTNVEQMTAIISICPQLEELNLEDPFQAALDLLAQEVRALKKLRITFLHEQKVLKLNKKLVLSKIEVENVSLDLSSISIALEHLSAKFCQLSSNWRIKNLKVLELIDCNVKKDLVLDLLENCNQLSRVAISRDVGLTDADVKRLVKTQKLKQLQELWLSMAKQLSSDSVILLMNHCEKLTLLGTLNGWNVEKIEVNYLRCVIYFANINLNLLYLNCF